MKKAIGIAISCFASFLSISSTAHAEEGKRVNLDWEAKYTYDGGPVAVKFLSTQIKDRKLIFDILIHNEEKEKYMCIWFNTSESAVHIDDELGGMYNGGIFTISPMDNKLAPNQRKKLKIALPEPDPEVKLVNIHFGFRVDNISSEPERKCGDSIIGGGELNFHKLDWDISALR